jgi:hypothetical protein
LQSSSPQKGDVLLSSIQSRSIHDPKGEVYDPDILCAIG